MWVIEGTSSYGAVLTGKVLASNFSVAEAPRVDSQHRYGTGKSDELDCARIARATLGLPVDKLPRARLGSGVRQAIRILVASRELLAGQRTRNVNALTALVRSNPLGIDARSSLSTAQIEQIASWRMRGEDIELQCARAEAKRLARQILELDCELGTNERGLLVL